ncbi:hypothetical protein ACVWY3_004748 [Bradyrhizobium sp. USDA 4486]
MIISSLVGNVLVLYVAPFQPWLLANLPEASNHARRVLTSLFGQSS